MPVSLPAKNTYHKFKGKNVCQQRQNDEGKGFVPPVYISVNIIDENLC